VQGYAALNSDFDSFYTRRLKERLDDCFARPVTAVAGRTIVCYDRTTADYNRNFTLTGKTTRALNVSSYNYLGFASSSGGCADAVEACLRKYGPSGSGARHDGSTLDLHVQAEKLVAKFVGAEAALVSSMGFATNSTTIPALVNKGCLIISDEFNHASIRFGARLSNAAVRWFKHNDMHALEATLREAISQGQPRTHRPWKKILVIVEGLYSMEGSLVNLPLLLELKQRYKVRRSADLTTVVADCSSISMLTRPTRSAPLARTDGVSATTSVSTLARSTSSWARSPSHSVQLEDTSRAARSSLTDSRSDLTVSPMARASPLPFLRRSSRPWAASWALPLLWPRQAATIRTPDQSLPAPRFTVPPPER